MHFLVAYGLESLPHTPYPSPDPYNTIVINYNENGYLIMHYPYN